MVLDTAENVNNGNPSPLEALLAGAEGFPPMLDIPPDADDETMVELAIALSLQQDQQGLSLLLLRTIIVLFPGTFSLLQHTCNLVLVSGQYHYFCPEEQSRCFFCCCFFCYLYWADFWLNLWFLFLIISGSSSSALGLQSLGLSGQAPSSSSLDAGTLSDTTASGNNSTSAVACCQPEGIFIFQWLFLWSQMVQQSTKCIPILSS